MGWDGNSGFTRANKHTLSLELDDLHLYLIINLIPAHKHKKASIMPSGKATWQVRKEW
jgi:hypothetical protein